MFLKELKSEGHGESGVKWIATCIVGPRSNLVVVLGYEEVRQVMGQIMFYLHLRFVFNILQGTLCPPYS